MRRFTVLLAAGAMSVLGSVALAFGPLVEPDAVPEDALILDIRTENEFISGHIPGAVNVPYAQWRGPKENPGSLPAEAELQKMLQGAGADLDDNILIVNFGEDASDFGASARVYWTLKSSGFQNLAVLNGGHLAWARQGDMAATGTHAVEPSSVEISFSDQWTMDQAGVKDVVDGNSDAVLIDARPDDFFKGKRKHDAAKSAGTIQGAINLVNFAWFGGPESPQINATPELVDRVKALAAENDGAPLVSFCNTGHWAATNWFAVSELAGVENVKLYPESMVGWTLQGNEAVPGTN